MTMVKRRIEYVLKHNKFFQMSYKLVMSQLLRFLGLFIKTDENLVLFVSFSGKAYNDSPKKIYEYIVNESIYRNLKHVWAFEEPNKFDIVGSGKVNIDTFEYFVTALRAKYWVTSVNIERGLHFKKNKTVYLNTWHGTPIKKVGNAVSGRNDFNCSNVDIFCYGSQHEKGIFLRDFKALEKNLLYSGMPRNDELYCVLEQQIEAYRKKVKIPSGKKVILYAPTWRDSKDNGMSYSLKSSLNIRKWQEQLQHEYVLLFRTHLFTNELLGVEFNDFVRDVSSYPDINHLLIIADVLISDYSATIFDYSVLGKPIICFGYDYEEYKMDRGFYFDIESELPGGVLKTEEEVLEKIIRMNYQEECKKATQLRDKYVEVGGNATEMCVKELMKRRSG